MNFQTIGERYSRIFFLLGQSSKIQFNRFHQTPSSNPSKLKTFSTQYLPSLIYVIIVIISTIEFLVFMSAKKTTFGSSVYSVSVASKALTTILAFKLTPFFSNTLNELWIQLLDLENYMNNVIQCKWSATKCEKQYLKKSFLVIFIIVMRVIAKFTLRGKGEMLQSCIALILLILSTVAHLHLQFYLDLFVFMLSGINKKLSSSLKSGVVKCHVRMQNDHKIKMLTEIEALKSLHLKLWKVCQTINSNFSWLLLSIITQTLSNVLHPFYFIIVDFLEDDLSKELQIISKFLFNFDRTQIITFHINFVFVCRNILIVCYYKYYNIS